MAKHLHLRIFQADSPKELEKKVNEYFHDTEDKIKQYGYVQTPPYSYYVVTEHDEEDLPE